MPADPSPHRRPSPLLLALSTLLLFLVWSHSFVAIGYLLGAEHAPARFDWLGLTVARFLPAALLAGSYCFGLRYRESVELLRAHWHSLGACGLLAVPCYNFALYYGQQSGVPPAIASLETALAPLILLVLGAFVLGEQVTARKLTGFAVALAGLLVIARARGGDGAQSHAAAVAITAIAPLSWSVYSVLSKPFMGRVSPVLWTFLALILGTLPLLLVLPFRGGPELVALDGHGWSAVAFLSLACTIFGFCLWAWLLRFLPASSLGLTVFLNPPLTTASKALLARVWPETFLFQIHAGEWIGGVVVLTGMLVALAPWRVAGHAVRPVPE